MRRSVLSATLAGLLLFTAACGDDEESSSNDDSEQQSDDNSSDDNDSNDDSNDDTDITVGDIPGISEDCEDLYSAWISLYSGIGVPGAQVADTEQVIEQFQDAVPDELDDDAAVFGAAISQYYAILAEHVDDPNIYTNPDVLAALDGLGSEQVTEAGDNINAYFEEACPVGE